MSIFPHPAAAGNKPLAWGDLPADIRERLAGEGINCAAAWRALSRSRKRSIFGITPSMAKQIDAAAGKEP